MTGALDQVRLSLIAAVAENGVIGDGDGMPWRLSSDMKRFKNITLGKPVVMGRKTYDTIGKPLPGRQNLVVSRRTDFAPEGVTVVADLKEALATAARAAPASDDREIIVMGGGEIYRATIDHADRLYVTHVEATPKGDILFPPIDRTRWRATSSERVPPGPKDSAATNFVVYERIVPKA